MKIAPISPKGSTRRPRGGIAAWEAYNIEARGCPCESF
jgi:hypothetical protein